VNENIPRTFDTVTIYIPHKYKENIIDSLLDVDINFRVIIKKSTLMDKFVIQTFEQEGNVKKIVYRDNQINIKVTVDEKTIFESTLTKEIFPQIGDEEFLSQAIMHGIWIEKYDKEEQCLTMSCNVIVPDTDWSYYFSINVDTKGRREILLESIN
jgi:metal-dependent HD superfamily phosphatase/phosphodiesterase